MEEGMHNADMHFSPVINWESLHWIMQPALVSGGGALPK
jgi:hypothetical protein